jgi:hypothetical protein
LEISHFAKKVGGGAGSLLGLLKLKASLCHDPRAHHAPAGDGRILDTACFAGIGGLQFGFEGGEERGEGAGALVIENDGAGEDAMTAAVGARGLDTTFRTHHDPIMVHDCSAWDELNVVIR